MPAADSNPVKSLLRFFAREVWTKPSREFPGAAGAAVRWYKVVTLTARGFRSDKVGLHATALTLYTLLSIVPVAALAFAVSKGFGLESRLEREILGRFPEQEALVLKVMDFARNLLENTREGLIAGIGVLLLFAALIRVVSQIETSFNDIWHVTRSRPVGSRVTNYVALVVLLPIVLIASSSLTVLVSTKLAALLPGAVGGLARLGLNGLTWFLLCALFMFLYMFIPNENVRWTSGLVGGVAAGTLFHAWEKIYVVIQVNLTGYNAIYGSFAALPLFILWLRTGWLIVMAGSKLAYMHQHLESYESSDEDMALRSEDQKKLALEILRLLTVDFSRGRPARTVDQVCRELEIPRHVMRKELALLVRTGLVSEVLLGDEEEEHGYQTARDPAGLRVADVLEALDRDGPEMAETLGTGAGSRALEAMRKVLAGAPENMLVRELTGLRSGKKGG